MLDLQSSPRNALRRQRGVSLLEVLIAVVVLSIGLLGMAGLQLSALRNNQSASERSNAVMQLYSITEALRADSDAVRKGEFNIGIGAATPSGSSFAESQVAAWRQRLLNNLGAGATGGIACASVTTPIPNSVCTITIRWDDSLGLRGSSEETLRTEVRL